MSDNEPPTFMIRLQCAFYILILCATIFVIIAFMGADLAANIQRIGNQGAYAAVSSWDIPAFITIPTLLSLITLLALKLFNKEQEGRTQSALKFAIFFALGAIVVRIPYGFAVSSLMENKGYSRCLEYSSPAMLSPTVWVKDPAYCIANSGSVRRDVLQWLDNTKQLPASIEVEEKVNLLLKEYDRLERQKYPGLYD